MAFFRRGKTSKKGGGDGSNEDAPDRDPSACDPDETSSRRMGVVSGVLTTPAAVEGETPFGDIVARRFGPPSLDGSESPRLPPRYESTADEKTAVDSSRPADDSPAAENLSVTDASPATDASQFADAPRHPPRRDHLRAVDPLFCDPPATPQLEVDSMAHIGRATTITGNIVAEEDLEIRGTIEGSVRLADHQLTVGNDGHVKASVEANIVMVYGKIMGDVVASDLVEIEKGGVVGGDIKAPRVIMHDGAIVVGGLDMSASLPSSADLYAASDLLDELPERPNLTSVASTDFDVLWREDV